MSNEILGLGETVRALRAEIQAAAEGGDGTTLQFELWPIELELQVVATKEKGAEGKISFRLFGAGAEIGASGKGSDERMQRVKFVLNPVGSGNEEKVRINRKLGAGQ